MTPLGPGSFIIRLLVIGIHRTSRQSGLPCRCDIGLTNYHSRIALGAGNSYSKGKGQLLLW